MVKFKAIKQVSVQSHFPSSRSLLLTVKWFNRQVLPRFTYSKFGLTHIQDCSRSSVRYKESKNSTRHTVCTVCSKCWEKTSLRHMCKMWVSAGLFCCWRTRVCNGTNGHDVHITSFNTKAEEVEGVLLNLSHCLFSCFPPRELPIRPCYQTNWQRTDSDQQWAQFENKFKGTN